MCVHPVLAAEPVKGYRNHCKLHFHAWAMSALYWLRSLPENSEVNPVTESIIMAGTAKIVTYMWS